MNIGIYKVNVFGDMIEIGADWSQSSCGVCWRERGDECWNSTQYQVADFSHDSHDAIVQILSDIYMEPSDVVKQDMVLVDDEEN